MFKSSKSDKHEKLYEFRFYRIAAQDVGRFKELANQYLPRRAMKSRLVGFWITELGAVNRVLHIWEYDSLSHRQAVRAEMLADADWCTFLSQVSPMFQKMDNWLCRCYRGDLSGVLTDQELYKLTTVQYDSVITQNYAKNYFKDSLSIKMKQPGFKAAFQTVLGNTKQFFVLESAGHPDEFLTNPDGFDSANTSVHTKILAPLPWNKWLQQ